MFFSALCFKIAVTKIIAPVFMANYQEYYGELSGILWRTIGNVMANYQESHGELSGMFIYFKELRNLTGRGKKLKIS